MLWAEHAAVKGRDISESGGLHSFGNYLLFILHFLGHLLGSWISAFPASLLQLTEHTSPCQSISQEQEMLRVSEHSKLCHYCRGNCWVLGSLWHRMPAHQDTSKMFFIWTGMGSGVVKQSELKLGRGYFSFQLLLVLLVTFTAFFGFFLKATTQR